MGLLLSGKCLLRLAAVFFLGSILAIMINGCSGVGTALTNTSNSSAPSVNISSSSSTINAGQSVTLTWSSSNATSAQISNIGTVSTSGSVTVSPAQTTTYVITVTGPGGTATGQVIVTVTESLQSLQHVIFMLQENRTFDTYFGMLNPYRAANNLNIGDDGKKYDVDGIDDKLTRFSNQDDEGDTFSLFKFTSTCIDDESSAWLESYGDVNRFDFLTARPILMDGFVHTAEGFAKSNAGSGQFTDLQGKRAMGYYDEQFLNYYYFMGSQFALSDRWFSPMSSKSTPNRIATMSGGTTQGLVRDPGIDDNLGALNIETIFQELDEAGVSWKIYYTVTDDQCLADPDGDCGTNDPNKFPATTFADFSYATKYLSQNPTQAACTPPKIGSQQAVGDPDNAFCIDPTHIAPLSHYFTDLTNGALASYTFIEAGYGSNDEHPGSGQSILAGQIEVAKILNAFMASSSWNNSVFFLSYDEGGGPFDHVPPVPGHTNDNTDASLGVTTDISSIAVNPDSFFPCLAPSTGPTTHCDLETSDPGANPGDAAAQQGFAAQLGFRLPNMVVSPFTRRHFVSHTPMDHTAVIKFVENRFIGPSAHLTNRDAAQPDLMEFFDFTNVPWKTPPTPPTPIPPGSTCHAASFSP
jgi:phospholipase C